MENELTKCPRCGFSLKEGDRMGNWLRCPACETSFRITLSAMRRIGPCPHGCGEVLTEEDYTEWGILQCPRCQGNAVADSDGAKTVLMRYAGCCPSCGLPVSEGDCIGGGEYACHSCGTHAFRFPDPRKPSLASVCPVCGEPLCASDTDARMQARKCPQCGSVFWTKGNVESFFDNDAYVMPMHTLKEFREACLDRLMRFGPGDIFTAMRIEEQKIMYFPFCRTPGGQSAPLFGGSLEAFLSKNITEMGKNCFVPKNAETMPAFNVELETEQGPYELDALPFCRTDDKGQLPAGQDGRAEFVPASKQALPLSSVEYRPLYYLRYSYGDNGCRTFYNWEGGYGRDVAEGLSATGLPMDDALNREKWYGPAVYNRAYLLISATVILLGMLCILLLSWPWYGNILIAVLTVLTANIRCLVARKKIDEKGFRARKANQRKKAEDMERIFGCRPEEYYINLTRYYKKRN